MMALYLFDVNIDPKQTEFSQNLKRYFETCAS